MLTNFLQSIEERSDLFFSEIQGVPQGHYVHFVMLRETESFPLFQTDGGLNTITVQAGVKAGENISRLVMFKRKQTTPERLKGRELLHKFEIISEDAKDKACVYNETKGGACKRCPDCILYGYAIGKGAERSKVYVDSAFSINQYEVSHRTFALNAPYETGTMTDESGGTKTSFSTQDHILPQVFFPAIVTLRDPVYEGFLYVLGNILRADRYGAQESRTGKVNNHLLAVVFANGEIFSNLRFSQAIYDQLAEDGKLTDPLSRDAVFNAAAKAYQNLMADEPVAKVQNGEWLGESLDALRKETKDLYQDEAQTRKVLETLNEMTRKYSIAMEKKSSKKAEE